MQKLKLTFRNGFTLIELLVVISIIGLLATLLAANFNAVRSRARDAQRKADSRNIQTALRVFYNDMRRYPSSDAGFNALAHNTLATCTFANVAAWIWNSAWTCGGRTYMSILPRDPSPDRSYRYQQTAPDVYTFKACLENASDEKCSLTISEAWCNTALSGCLYIVQP